jgi:hypothetical protein
MVTAAEMLRKFKAVQLPELMAETAEKDLTTPANLNRDQLFKQGVTADGGRLAPYKNKYYAQKKYEMNPLPGYGHPDAYLTGELQRELYVEIRGVTAVFDSTSDHAAFMIKRDGEGIFGFTDESRSTYSHYLMPQVVNEIRKRTGVQ